MQREIFPFTFLPSFPLTSEKILIFLPNWNLQSFSMIKLSLYFQQNICEKMVKTSSWDWTCVTYIVNLRDVNERVACGEQN